VEYSTTNGELLNRTQTLGGLPKESFRPSGLQRSPTGFALVDADAKVEWLGDDFSVKRTLDLTDVKGLGQQKITSAFEWLVAGNELLTFSDLEFPDGTTSSAFLKIPSTAPSRFSILSDLAIDDAGRDLYLFGHPYLAASSTNGYVLVMGPEPAIFEVPLSGSPKVRRLEVGKLLGKRPSLPKKQGIATVRALYAAVGKSSMPVGLYFDRDRLYVLFRNPTDRGTEWLIYRLNPKSGSLESTMKLGSTAAHLAIVPGPNSWAILEKGEVLGLGQQSILGLLTVPSEVIRQSSDGRLCSSMR